LIPIAANQSQHQQYNYSIVLQDNIGDIVTNKLFSTSHCDWTEESIFTQSDPFEVNKQVIRYIKNSIAVKKVRYPNVACYCKDDQHFNCSIDELGPVYPGQTFSLSVLVNFSDYKDIVELNVESLKSLRACRSHNIKDHMLAIPGTCVKIEYKSILYKNGNSCNVFLRISAQSKIYYPPVLIINHYYFLNVYRIKFWSCPLGFALNEALQICQCDLILKSVVFSAESCNIDTQTILRPARNWIIGRMNTDGNHIHEVSSQCPFDYCLPHSSQLYLSNPDSQCQFHRTSVLCRKCKEGLSTVFGTSQCKQCSNYYLFLLVPFFIMGIFIVVFLFVSNFTVSNGNINGLIFYASIVSINGSVFFPSYGSTIKVQSCTNFIS